MRGAGGLGDLAQEKGQREGAGAAAGDPQTVHGAHPIPTPPAWGPTSPLTHTFPPFHVSAHFPQTVLHTRAHTHTHTPPSPWSCPSHSPPHTLMPSVSPEGCGLAWTKLTPLQMGPFPWVSLETGHRKLWGWCRWVEWGTQWGNGRPGGSGLQVEEGTGVLGSTKALGARGGCPKSQGRRVS